MAKTSLEPGESKRKRKTHNSGTPFCKNMDQTESFPLIAERWVQMNTLHWIGDRWFCDDNSPCDRVCDGTSGLDFHYSLVGFYLFIYLYLYFNYFLPNHTVYDD